MPSELELKEHIRAKAVELGAGLGRRATSLADDNGLVPKKAPLGSASVRGCLVWFGRQASIEVHQDELSPGNLGPITRMAELLSNQQAH